MEKEPVTEGPGPKIPAGTSDAARSVFSSPLNPAELNELLQRIDLLVNATQFPGEAGPNAEPSATALRRIEDLRRLHAPFLDLGRGPLRWIAAAANLPVYPWGRKQRRFNENVLAILEDLRTRLAETQNVSDLLSDLRARVLRMEQLLREAGGASECRDER